MENICQSLGKNSDKMVKGPFKSADFDGNGEFGKNRPAVAISQMRWQSGPLWKWRFWRKWHIWRKLRKSTSLRYKSKGDGKCGPLWKWRFWRKWHIWRTFAIVLAKIQMTCQRVNALAIFKSYQSLIKIPNGRFGNLNDLAEKSFRRLVKVLAKLRRGKRTHDEIRSRDFDDILIMNR